MNVTRNNTVFRGRPSRTSQRNSGQVILVAALGIVTMLGVLGLALDGGHLYSQRRQMQNAADAAAFAGTRVLAEGKSDNSQVRNDLVWQAIYTYAKNNAVANPDTDVEATYTDGKNPIAGGSLGPGKAGSPPDGTAGVQVRANRTVGTFFIRVLGVTNFHATALAAAKITPGKPNSGYAIFAKRSPTDTGNGKKDTKQGKKAVEIKTGKKQVSTINGAIHSNHGVSIKGKKYNLNINGDVTQVSGFYPVDKRTGSFKGRVNFTPALDDPPPYTDQLRHVSPIEEYPVKYNLADFAPGGVEAAKAQSAGAYHSFTGKTDLKDFIAQNKGVLPDGLYYVDGDVKLKYKTLPSAKVTIVATGKVKIDSKQTDLQPYAANLLAYSDLGDERNPTNKTSVKIKLNKGANAAGIVFAPYSKISFRLDSSNFNGSLIGRMVKFKGKAFTFNAPASYMTGGGGITLYQ